MSKRVVRCVLALLAAVALAGCGKPTPQFESVDITGAEYARDFHLLDTSGQPRAMADYRGKVVLLNIWATWCVPCREEMPTLDRLQATLGGEDFEVVPVSIDRKGMAEVDKFYAEIGLQHLARYITPAANGALDQLGIFGIPASLLIDRQGRELGRLIGPAKWDSPDMVAFLKSIIAK